jgi:glutamate racemase
MIHACRAVLEQQTQLLLFCCTHYQLLKRGEFTKKRDELHIFVLEAVIWKYSKLISFSHLIFNTTYFKPFSERIV